MNQSVIEQVESMRPAIKREWGVLLRAEPTVSALGHPDTLAHLMDETVSQMLQGFRGQSLKRWIRRSPALLAPLQRHCQCRLNPLLNYYATGELALRASFRKELDVDTCEALLTIFHIKAQQDLETLCTVCQARGGAGCRSAKSTPAALATTR